MASEKATSDLVSLAILKKVIKLQDHKGYLKWRRIMQEYLKILDLWIYI